MRLVVIVFGAFKVLAPYIGIGKDLALTPFLKWVAFESTFIAYMGFALIMPFTDRIDLEQPKKH